MNAFVYNSCGKFSISMNFKVIIEIATCSLLLMFFSGNAAAEEVKYENIKGLAQSSLLLIPIIIIPLLIFYKSRKTKSDQNNKWMKIYLIWTFLPYLGLWIIAYSQDTGRFDMSFNYGLFSLCFAVFSPYIVWAVQARKDS